MIQRFRAFSAILMTGVLAYRIAAAAQAPAAQRPAPRAVLRLRRHRAARRHGQEHRVRFALLRAAHLYRVAREGPGSIDLLHRRFREHTNRLFRKHGMTIVGFWQPMNSGMERTLIYVLAYKDGAARDAAWNAFRNGSGMDEGRARRCRSARRSSRSS